MKYAKGVKLVYSVILYKRFSSLEINITMNINVSIFFIVQSQKSLQEIFDTKLKITKCMKEYIYIYI